MEKKLPRIAMGTWAWGDKDGYFGNKTAKDEFRHVFEKGMSEGLNLWDTATAYSSGESERILGSLANEYGRENVIVSTKFTPQMAAMYQNSVEKMCDASLKRMGMDYFDIYWIHNPIGAPEYTEQLIPLLKSGKVRSVGVSNHNLAQIKEANEILHDAGYRLAAVQNHFSLLNRSSETSGILEYCKQNDIVFFGYMVLEQGALTGKYDSKHPFADNSSRAKVFNPMLLKLDALIDCLRQIALSHGVSASQIATAYVIKKGVLPIIGVTKTYQVEEAIKAIEIKLTAEEIQKLENAADKTSVTSIQFWENKME